MIHVLDLKFLGYNNTIASFLIDTGDGLALIETGPHSVMNNIEAEIKAVGYDIKDVKHVFITHIHLDHAGACWAFAQNNGATIYLHPFGKRHLANPEKLMNSARMIYQDKMDMLWGEMHPIPEEQLHTVEDETEIGIGNVTFKAWHTPGHAVHHIAWQVGDVVFSGDVAGVRINKELVVPPCPPPDINVEDWEKSIATLRKINPSKIYLTHFGEITDIADHLDSLEKRLHAWANWIKPHWEAGKKPQEVTPAFQAYVKQDLLDHGVSEAGVEQYEAANPSWMSVAGLMRYWRKKSI